jgi:glycosyltransferase involved in cell wall biosynthesis
MEKYAVLIPVFNEEKNVVALAERLEALDIPFMFIDDGSTDKTVTQLWLKEIPSMAYFPNRGKGWAIQLGAKALIAAGYDWILVIDGDNQFKTEDIELFDNTLLFGESEADIFIGNRFAGKTNMPWVRRCTNRFMSWVVSSMAGQKIPDSQCGFRLIHKDIFTCFDCESNRFAYESEQLIKASWYGGRIKSIPIDCNYPKGGKSSIKIFRDSWLFWKMIFRLTLRKMFNLF